MSELTLASLIRLVGLLLLLCVAANARLASVTYNKQIAPIILEHCASCHRKGESGGFSLLTYEDARRNAHLIEQVTRSRFMPPWLPEHGYGNFQGEDRLSTAQISLIAQWVTSGTPEGSAADAPAAPVFTPGWNLGKPDLILTVSKPFTVPADGPDLFWNFVLSPRLLQTRYIKSLEVRPGGGRSVHHANLILDRNRSSRRQHPASGNGFPGMDLNIETASFDPDSHFLFWKPGGRPWIEPPGMSWRLEPGSDLILNVHFHPTGKPEIIQPTVGFYFSDQPPTRFPMLLKIQKDRALDIPAGAHDVLVSDDFQLPIDVKVAAVYPHAHYLATLMEGYATLPGGKRIWLIRIPRWDVNWQSVYHYSEPLTLPKGTVVSLRFHYDNSSGNPRNPNSPPRRVTAGNQSTDEMGHLWLQLLTPHGLDDRAILQEAMMRHRIANDPLDASAYFNLGSLLLSHRDFPGAVSSFETALRFEPEAPMTLNDLGVALQSQGRLSAATERFEHALRNDPAYLNARFNLANVLAAAGRWSEALQTYRQVLSEDPSDSAAKDQVIALLIRMGNTATAKGNLSDAASYFEQVLAEHPDDVDIRNNLAIVLARSGDLKGAADQFAAVLRLNPAHVAARRNLEAIRAKLSTH